jgi:excisionase family DNA binding protein
MDQWPDGLLRVTEDNKPAFWRLAEDVRRAESVQVLLHEAPPIDLPQPGAMALARSLACLAASDVVEIEPRDDLLTTQEAADFLGISRPTLIKLLGDADGQIPCARPAGASAHRRVHLMDLVEFRRRRSAALAETGFPAVLMRRTVLRERYSGRQDAESEAVDDDPRDRRGLGGPSGEPLPDGDVIQAAEEQKPLLWRTAADVRSAESVRLVLDGGSPQTLPEPGVVALARSLACLAAADFVVIEPRDDLLTTQEAAEFLGVSRPTLIKLLGHGDGEIPYETPTSSGSHRRVRLLNLVRFRHDRTAAVAERGVPQVLERRRQLRERFAGDQKEVAGEKATT